MMVVYDYVTANPYSMSALRDALPSGLSYSRMEKIDYILFSLCFNVGISSVYLRII